MTEHEEAPTRGRRRRWRVPVLYASWYSPDHYATFRFMFPPQCLALPARWLLP